MASLGWVRGSGTDWEKRQKNTYKAAYLQINGAQTKTALQVLKECIAMGRPAVVWRPGAGT